MSFWRQSPAFCGEIAKKTQISAEKSGNLLAIVPRKRVVSYVMQSKPNLRQLTLLASSLFLATAVACGGDDNTDRDAGVKTKDSGTSSGADMGTAVDMGTPDTGVQGPCNPVTGADCLAMGQICVYDVNTKMAACRVPAMTKIGFMEQCSPTLQDCADGLTCNQIQGEATPSCKQVCKVSNGNNDCTSRVPANAMPDQWGCGQLEANDEYGLCFNRGTACSPTDMVSNCAMGEVCALADGDFNTSCQPAGTAQLGGACMPGQNNCAAGQGICIPLQEGTSCYEACTLPGGTCSQMGYTCQGLQTMGGAMSAFGVCIPAPQLPCHPLEAMSCPMGQNCSINMANNGVECRATGMVALQGDCSMNNCQNGLFCTPIQGGQKLCLTPCYPDMSMCPMGQSCQMLVGNLGICN